MVSKKWIGALAGIAMCSGACANAGPAGDPTGAEDTASQQSAQVATSFTCTPLLAATAPLLTCGASAAAQLSLATSLQASLITSMQAAFSSLTLQTQIAQNQVILTSTAPEFAAFFGPQIVVPLTPAGLFTTTIPFPVGTLAPGFMLSANVFGFVPGLFPITPTTPLITNSLLPAVDSAQFAALNSSLLASTSASASLAASTAALSAATLPLNFLFTTPVGAALPLTCSGTIPLSCL